jgi:ribosome-associated translation inhibitor RaiA/cold shock CspA family protein
MQIPAEISFHNLAHSDDAERRIRDRIAKLERRYDRLTTCRVRVEQRAVNASESIPPVVRIEMSVPGHKDLAVTHEPEHLMQKYKRPTLNNAINEAFRIAERRLSDYKASLKDHTQEADHEASHEFLGEVAEMHPENSHGFLLTKEGGLLYFHRNSILTGDFDALERGTPVHYVEEVGDTGPIATKVRVKA